MTKTTEHPWQNGPQELFQFAIDALRKKEDVKQRIAFLLLDVCVETTFRTYLGLPGSTSGSKIAHSERRKYTGGTFHDLVTGVSLAAGGKVRGVDLDHAKFYHDIRNRLYHDGNGITVREEHVQGYAVLTAMLLRQLINIDCDYPTQVIPKQPSADSVALKQVTETLPQDIAEFEHLIKLNMERLEPRMIYPSSIKTLEELSKFDIATFPRKLEDFRELIERNISDETVRSWLLGLLAGDLTWDRPQVIANSQFLMELARNPTSLYALIIGLKSLPIDDIGMDSLDGYDDISFVRQDDYSIMGIYESCKFFQDLLAGDNRMNVSELQLLDRCQELQEKLRLTISKLKKLTVT